MKLSEKSNQNLMQFIKKMHDAVENTDLEKHRHSQEHLGALMSGSKDVEYREIDIDGMHGEWVALTRPHTRKQVILYCHGGGYATGSSQYARMVTTKLAMAASMDICCFDYRLAPEQPYPAALEDAAKAWNYLMFLGYGAENVILAGDSAGGNLALVLIHMLKQERRFLPGGLVLLSPWVDLTSSGKTHMTKADVDPILSEPYIRRMIEAYAQGERLENPLISPIFGEFTDFPPTCIQVGENEILLSDSQMLARKLQKANVPVKLEVFKGMWHVFQMAPFKAATEAVDKAAEFIFDIYQ